MKAVLILVKPDGHTRSFPLAQGTTIIGRGENCTLRIPLLEVSRKHCELTANNGTVALRDLGSSNGTYVNGKRVLEKKLKAGDRLHVGNVTFAIQIDGVPAETDVIASPASAEPVVPHEAVAPAQASTADLPTAKHEEPETLEPLPDAMSPDVDAFSPGAALDDSSLDLADSAGGQSGDFAAFLDEFSADEGKEEKKKKKDE